LPLALANLFAPVAPSLRLSSKSHCSPPIREGAPSPFAPLASRPLPLAPRLSPLASHPSPHFPASWATNHPLLAAASGIFFRNAMILAIIFAYFFGEWNHCAIFALETQTNNLNKTSV
jgi:hypothetical protein